MAVFSGMLPWFLFSETVQRSSSSLVEQANLITKTIFPAEIVPVTIFLSSLISHLLAVALFILWWLCVTEQRLTSGDSCCFRPACCWWGCSAWGSDGWRRRCGFTCGTPRRWSPVAMTPVVLGHADHDHRSARSARPRFLARRGVGARRRIRWFTSSMFTGRCCWVPPSRGAICSSAFLRRRIRNRRSLFPPHETRFRRRVVTVTVSRRFFSVPLVTDRRLVPMLRFVWRLSPT